MIQFNLLPDVKLEYIKAKYRRRIITIISMVVAGFFISVFVLMFLFVRVNQTRHISNLDKEIDTNLATLRENPDLDKVLTVQSQLGSLPMLHEDKVMSSRIFDYLSKVTPNNASVTNVDIDFENGTIVIKGVSDALSTINRLVDTIKFTEFSKEDNQDESKNAFSEVVLKQFSINDASGTEDAVSYEVEFKYDEEIFSNTAKDNKPLANTIKLTVPSIVSTRSEIQKPSKLFEEDKSGQSQENVQEGGNQ